MRRPDFRPIMRRFMAGHSINFIAGWERSETWYSIPKYVMRRHCLFNDVVEDAIRRAMLASERRRKGRRK